MPTCGRLTPNGLSITYSLRAKVGCDDFMNRDLVRLVGSFGALVAVFSYGYLGLYLHDYQTALHGTMAGATLYIITRRPAWSAQAERRGKAKKRVRQGAG